LDESVVETQRIEKEQREQSSSKGTPGEKHGVERLLSLGIGTQGMDSSYKIDEHSKGLHKSGGDQVIIDIIVYCTYTLKSGEHM
jgi:hypothetical protein